MLGPVIAIQEKIISEELLNLWNSCHYAAHMGIPKHALFAYVAPVDIAF